MPRKPMTPGTKVVPSAKANPDTRAWLTNGGEVVRDDGSMTVVKAPCGTHVYCYREGVKRAPKGRR